MRKVCIQVFERLATDWVGPDQAEALPGFREYIMKQVGSCGIRSPPRGTSGACCTNGGIRACWVAASDSRMRDCKCGAISWASEPT